ncbi:MAG: cytochrome c biogenesis protein CcdA [Planctomycetota bacterium]
MRARSRALWLRLSLLLLVSLGPSAAGQDHDWFKATARLAKEMARPGEAIQAEVAIEVKQGYHLTKDMTKVVVSAPEGISVGQIETPTPKRLNIPSLGGEMEVYEGKGVFSVPLQIGKTVSPGEKEIKLTLTYQGCSETACFLPTEKEFPLKLTVEAGEAVPSQVAPPPSAGEPSRSEKLGLSERFSSALSEGNYVVAGILAFFAGILLSLTPCVYPIIPITVGVIGAGAGAKKSRGFFLSIVYVLGIATMFSILGVVAASTGSMFGEAAGSQKFVAPLAALFVILGFGMMGAFDLQLPPAIAEKFGGKKGAGIVGVFLMGFLGGVIVSPCGAPLIAVLLLHVAKTGDRLLGFIMFFVMSWGLGILFIVIGTFSGVVAALPRSGGWMEVVKKAMGVAIIAAALYYGRILVRPEAMGAVVAVLLVVAGIYLSDFLKHGFKAHKGALTLGFLTVVGGILAGAWIGTPEKAQGKNQVEKDSPIAWVHSVAEADSRAITEKKPQLLDFGAEWCTQCKRLDQVTFRDPRIVEQAKGFIMVKVDYESKTPEVERLKTEHGIVTLPTILFKNSNGEVVKDDIIREFVTADQLLEHMKRIR